MGPITLCLLMLKASAAYGPDGLANVDRAVTTRAVEKVNTFLLVGRGL